MIAVLIHPLHPSRSVRSLCKLCGWEAELEDMYKKSIVAERDNSNSGLKNVYQSTQQCTEDNCIADDLIMTHDTPSSTT